MLGIVKVKNYGYTTVKKVEQEVRKLSENGIRVYAQKCGNKTWYGKHYWMSRVQDSEGTDLFRGTLGESLMVGNYVKSKTKAIAQAVGVLDKEGSIELPSTHKKVIIPTFLGFKKNLIDFLFSK